MTYYVNTTSATWVREAADSDYISHGFNTNEIAWDAPPNRKFCLNCGGDLEEQSWVSFNTNSYISWNTSHTCPKDWSLGYVVAPSVSEYVSSFRVKDRGWECCLPPDVEKAVILAVCESLSSAIASSLDRSWQGNTVTVTI